MRCPDCNKFVAFDEGEYKVESIEVDDDGNVRAEVRVVLNCAECSQELKEARLEMEVDHTEECKEHQSKGHELEVDEGSAQSVYYDKRKHQWVNKYGRYAKTMYGATLSCTITYSCGKLSADGSVSDKVRASGMDELV
jgi:Zn finger protein HypA/HybF involved in hydrogenase expression